LWIQFALLGAFVLIAPILFTSQRLLDSGRDVLIEHETIDLSDESNLRVNEFREDMAYLARDVRIQVRAQPLDLPATKAVEAVATRVKLPEEPSWNEPDTVQTARRRYLHGTLVGVYAYRGGNGAEVSLEAWSNPLPTQAERRAALIQCLTDVSQRMAHRPDFNRSGLHYQPGVGEEPGRTIFAIAEPRGDHTIALILNFTKYVNNRQRNSPRHLYLVTDPSGRLLIHPDPKVPKSRPELSSVIGWEYPVFGGRSWFDTQLAPTDEANTTQKMKRMASVVRSGGARLRGTEIPTMQYLYRKGYFASGQDFATVLGDEPAQQATTRLNQLLAATGDHDPQLRVGEANPRAAYIEVAHPTREGLQTVCDTINAWWRETSGHPNAIPKWTKPLLCRTFQGQLTPLRVDLNDENDPAWLVVAASTEELREDIDDRFWRVFVRWVLPTMGIACLAGMVIVMTLTHSVNRLAVTASTLNTEKPKKIPLNGPYEVSQLAYALVRLNNDVGERDRQLRERAARYETILRAAGEGVIIANSSGTIEEANKAAGRMFGYTPEELIGMPVTALVKNPNDAKPIDEGIGPRPSSITQTMDAVQGRRKNGSVFWLELNMKPVPLRDRVVVTCIFRDVSLRRESEERIRRMNDELENRVRQRTAELEEANTKLEVALQEAETAVRAKDAFVANMSHELRQPLHIIIGFTEALKEDAAEMGAEATIPDLNKILAAAKHLLELINDILDLAKISAGRLELSVAPFPLPRLISDVATLVGPLAEKNENRFVLDAPADLGSMTADERRVRQMLLNLLSNAFKFTKQGTVTLRVRRISDQGQEWVRFVVSDTGKGMTSEQVSRLFQRFYQADSTTTRGAGGTGLGLAITQSFCELMGGQPIRVTSQEGVGSEFTLTLPLTTSQPLIVTTKSVAPPTLPQPAEPEAAVGRTVLVIDDDPMVRELMSRFLTKEGFRVVLAENGERGLTLARECHPCVITLDVMMPGSDGWTVLVQLKENPITADIPVVMVTIVDDSGRGFALGAAEYLTKPIDWQRLAAILRKYLSPDRPDSILVIDDQADNRDALRRHLERDGWAVVEAEDGEQGLKAFEASRPGLILLDLMMPVLDGFGFLDELAKRFPRHRVPVVVLTAKELTSQDFDRLNGRVARILEKGDLANLDTLVDLIRRTAS
jgi:PAS domain S-box-containing protein